jgi:PadR family transcriptional regulator PadR
VKIGKDLVAAAATPMVLGILAEGESYGYAILQRVGELSGGELEWSDGMLYPLLHRLGASPAGRPRKHYRLSPAGEAAFAEQRRQWSVVSHALQQVWTDRDGGRSTFALGGAPA